MRPTAKELKNEVWWDENVREGHDYAFINMKGSKIAFAGRTGIQDTGHELERAYWESIAQRPSTIDLTNWSNETNSDKLAIRPPKTTAESSGGSCDYYKVLIENPTTAKETYTAECNDVIESLDMTYAEANMFKEIWRSAAARTLGKLKEGHTDKRGAEKIVFFAARNLIQKAE